MKRAMFIVPGEPVGKGRPKFSTTSGYAKAYTPAKTRSYEEYVQWVFKANNNGIKFDTQPLRIYIQAFFGVPKSDGHKKALMKYENIIRPTKKPDFDNIAKIICDALNGLAYKDDSQIVECIVRKFYGEEPRVEVVIESLIEGE